MVCSQLLCRPMCGARAAGTFQATVNNVLISSGSGDGILCEETRERQMFAVELLFMWRTFLALCVYA